MSDRTTHRRVLSFAVTGVLLGAPGCTSNEAPKAEKQPEAKPKSKPEAEKDRDPVQEFAPNPGPNERNGLPPEVAPTTAVKEPPPVEEPIDEDPPDEPVHVNEGPKPEPRPPIKVNPGPAASIPPNHGEPS